jgi:hypothetical protein
MRQILTIAAVVCSAAGVASAQGQGQNPMSYDAVSKAKAGSWAEYTMSMKGQPPIKMKYAVVDKSDKKMAMEIDSSTPMGQVMMHMEFEAAPPSEWKLVKARMQLGANPPQDMPTAALATGGIKKNETPGKLVGSEKVTTPAGTFETKHYTRVMPKEAGGSTVEMWMSDKAVPTGLVKMADSRGVEVVLSSTGTDAKPKMDLSKPAPGGTAPAPAPATKPTGESAKPAAPTKK